MIGDAIAWTAKARLALQTFQHVRDGGVDLAEFALGSAQVRQRFRLVGGRFHAPCELEGVQCGNFRLLRATHVEPQPAPVDGTHGLTADIVDSIEQLLRPLEMRTGLTEEGKPA